MSDKKKEVNLGENIADEKTNKKKKLNKKVIIIVAAAFLVTAIIVTVLVIGHFSRSDKENDKTTADSNVANITTTVNEESTSEEQETTEDTTAITDEGAVVTSETQPDVTVNTNDTQPSPDNTRVDGLPTLNSDGYYELYTYNDLKWFANHVNSGNYTANAVVKDIIIFDEEIWTPIGNEAHPYNGNFKGGNYDMLGIFCDDANASVVGLFGCIGSSGRVEKVIVFDGYLNAKDYVGVICGKNYGTIYDCSVGGRTNGDKYIGGVAGYNAGDIINCSSSGSVGGNQAVGGIAGIHAAGTIDDCVMVNSVYGELDAGGIAGICEATITNSNTSGLVDGRKNTGGIVGVAEATAVIKDCIRYGPSDGFEVWGFIVGLNKTANIENCVHRTDWSIAIGYCEYHGKNNCPDCDTTIRY